MPTYAIGDIHGCFDELQKLLEKIRFDPRQDTLWFTGDLINGGPKPIETLRFIKKLGPKHICVLGNHDLTLLAIAAGKTNLHADKERIIGFEPVLNAPDRTELLAWLQNLPLIHFDAEFNTLLVHAGVLPIWNLSEIQTLAEEVESMLHGPRAAELFSQMFGDLPDTWNNNLFGWERIRFAINCFTRMRFCDAHGKIDLRSKGPASAAPTGFAPWFSFVDRPTRDINIIFGHWAALEGKSNQTNVYAIDTGCVWGNSLTALCLNTWQRFAVDRH